MCPEWILFWQLIEHLDSSVQDIIPRGIEPLTTATTIDFKTCPKFNINKRPFRVTKSLMENM